MATRSLLQRLRSPGLRMRKRLTLICWLILAAFLALYGVTMCLALLGGVNLHPILIPLLLEAVVLFIREPTRKRATWLGVVFFMNALTSIHWFVLTLVPLGLSAMLLLLRSGGWRKSTFWR